MLIILLLCCMIVGLVAFSANKNLYVAPTAAGSIVMALGIFIQGVWQHMSGQSPDSLMTRTLVIGTTLVWLYLLVSYIASIRRSSFYRDHLADPVQRFGIGTWVAGTSTLLINLFASFGVYWVQETIHIMAVLNAGLWLFLLYFMCLGWYQILLQKQYDRIHGVLLLSTVSTQSIVLLFHQVFSSGYVAFWLNQSMIALGLLFYLISVSLILYRYSRRPDRLIADWTDTNCILYGALAITGAVVQATHAWSDTAILTLWWITLLILIVVECTEGIRAILRIRQKGWRHGIGIYNTAQWTRLFTLGMFYFFTMRTEPLYIEHTRSALAQDIHRWILNGGAWIISILLIIELILWIQAIIARRSARIEGDNQPSSMAE
ncbi:hypothetical protein [Paenibacillus bovis]|uniref:Uncharacterized protein n=1 Tax=Paenibacillus bovis TaxID=1616788 RepID=A0A172ZHQ6_9BACL|nr:hypothetical protein [Paenibacillus bovis]ANF97156.1 hypothetical protein AR543_14865 [Paenibacillus bovis]